MMKIRPGNAKITYIYPEDIIKVWGHVAFWISPLAVLKLVEIFTPTYLALKAKGWVG